MNKNLFEELYFKEKRSIRDMAAFFGKTTGFVRYRMQKYGIKSRSLHEAGILRCELKPHSNPGREGMHKNPNYGKDHHNYKGGYVRKDGYKVIYILGKQWLEHDWIWTLDNGKIPEEYHVHHINGNKLDNRIENLGLFLNSKHQKLHPRKRSASGRFTK